MIVTYCLCHGPCDSLLQTKECMAITICWRCTWSIPRATWILSAFVGVAWILVLQSNNKLLPPWLSPAKLILTVAYPIKFTKTQEWQGIVLEAYRNGQQDLQLLYFSLLVSLNCIQFLTVCRLERQTETLSSQCDQILISLITDVILTQFLLVVKFDTIHDMRNRSHFNWQCLYRHSTCFWAWVESFGLGLVFTIFSDILNSLYNVMKSTVPAGSR